MRRAPVSSLTHITSGNGIQAIKETGGWRVTGIVVQAESVTAPLPKEYLPYGRQS